MFTQPWKMLTAVLTIFLRRFTKGKTYATLKIQLYTENNTGQPISWETYLHVQVCVDCFRSLKESESVQLMIHEVLTSEIKSHSLPGVATIISGYLFKSLCCFWGAIPPTSNNLEKKMFIDSNNFEVLCSVGISLIKDTSWNRTRRSGKGEEGRGVTGTS